MLWTIGKMNEYILVQIMPKTLLEEKVTKLRLSSFGHILRRQSSLEKRMMLGKIKSRRKEGEGQI